jgi:hypothetical protein
MSKLKFCLVTPSYAPDFQRCWLLSKSIEQFALSRFTHYIIVDQQDYSLFTKLKNSYTEIIAKEEILPWWLNKLPFFTKKNLWLSWKSLPVRGWLLQQLIKLAIANYIEEEILVFADSDVTFIRPFDFHQYLQGERVRFFSEPDSVKIDDNHLPQWYSHASRLLDTRFPKFPVSNYMSQLIFWRRNNVLQLHNFLEQTYQRNWIETLCNSWHLSEYILYGVFIEQVIKGNSGHYLDHQDICHNYWLEKPMSNQELKKFFAEIKHHQIATMISAKANIPVDNYLNLVIC